MPSKSKETILLQKSDYETAFEKRQKELKDSGLPKDAIRKNAALRHLKAKVRESNRRLLAISGIEKKIEELTIHKAKKAEKGAEKETAPKKSKQPPSEGKGKKREGSF
jgi:hypothetical protein